MQRGTVWGNWRRASALLFLTAILVVSLGGIAAANSHPVKKGHSFSQGDVVRLQPGAENVTAYGSTKLALDAKDTYKGKIRSEAYPWKGTNWYEVSLLTDSGTKYVWISGEDLSRAHGPFDEREFATSNNVFLQRDAIAFISGEGWKPVSPNDVTPGEQPAKVRNAGFEWNGIRWVKVKYNVSREDDSWDETEQAWIPEKALNAGTYNTKANEMFHYETGDVVELRGRVPAWRVSNRQLVTIDNHMNAKIVDGPRSTQGDWYWKMRVLYDGESFDAWVLGHETGDRPRIITLGNPREEQIPSDSPEFQAGDTVIGDQHSTAWYDDEWTEFNTGITGTIRDEPIRYMGMYWYEVDLDEGKSAWVAEGALGDHTPDQSTDCALQCDKLTIHTYVEDEPNDRRSQADVVQRRDAMGDHRAVVTGDLPSNESHTDLDVIAIETKEGEQAAARLKSDSSNDHISWGFAGDDNEPNPDLNETVTMTAQRDEPLYIYVSTTGKATEKPTDYGLAVWLPDTESNATASSGARGAR